MAAGGAEGLGGVREDPSDCCGAAVGLLIVLSVDCTGAGEADTPLEELVLVLLLGEAELRLTGVATTAPACCCCPADCIPSGSRLMIVLPDATSSST